MQHVSNRKRKIPRSQLSRVGLIILNNRTKIFCEKFGVSHDGDNEFCCLLRCVVWYKYTRYSGESPAFII